MKHPLDIINKCLENGYYDNLPPFSYAKDAATISYLMGYCSKTILFNGILFKNRLLCC